MIKIVLNSTFELDGIDPSSGFALTFNEAEFKSLTARGSSFSNLVEFAKTARNVQFFGPLDSVNFSGSSPYVLYNCDLYDDDLLLFSGVFKLIESKRTFKGRVFGAGAGLFEILKGVKLNALDLSILDHTYNAATINALRTGTTGVVYPNINYGFWTGETSGGSGEPFTEFFPAVYIEDILTAACTQAGYTYTATGSSRIIPFSKKDFQQEASLNAQLATTLDTVYTLNGSNTSQGIDFDDVTDPLSVTEYSAALGRYIVMNKGTIKVQGSVDYTAAASGGSVQMQLRDNTGTIYDYVSISSGDSGTFSFEVEVNAPGPGGFALNVTLFRTVGSLQVTIETGSTFDLISGVRQIIGGDTVAVGDTLPDFLAIDLFKYMAVKLNALMIADNQAKTFQFVRFQDIADNIGGAVDWRAKVFNEEDIRLLYHLDEYAQSNALEYLPRPSEDPSANPNEIGAGFLNIADTTLEASKVFYSAPFAATAIFEGFEDLGAMPFIPRYSSTSADYREPDIDPAFRVMEAQINNEIFIQIAGTAPPANQCNPIFEGFNVDIAANYTAFASALNTLKVIEVDLQLNNLDIEFFDVTKPVYLLNAYWFVLKIDQFAVGNFAPTKVKLLRLS